MALNPSNSSNLEQLALKGLTGLFVCKYFVLFGTSNLQSLVATTTEQAVNIYVVLSSTSVVWYWPEGSDVQCLDVRHTLSGLPTYSIRTSNVFSRFKIRRIFSRTRRQIRTSGLHDRHHMSTPTGHQNNQVNKCALPNSLKGPK